MLIKLMKYEWKAVWKVLLIINALTIFATVSGSIAISLISNDSAAVRDVFQPVTDMLLLFYYATVCSVSFAMTIYTGIRFYQNLYTDEGYLTHTLPVTKTQLILSRLAVHLLCMLITGFFVVLSVCVLTLPSVLTSFGNPLRSVPMLLSELSYTAGPFIPLAVISSLLRQASRVLEIYCAISLGQTCRRHKVMGSVLYYAGIHFGIQVLYTLLTIGHFFTLMGALFSYDSFDFFLFLNHVFLVTALISLFFSVIFYLVTLYIMDQKLNLD